MFVGLSISSVFTNADRFLTFLVGPEGSGGAPGEGVRRGPGGVGRGPEWVGRGPGGVPEVLQRGPGQGCFPGGTRWNGIPPSFYHQNLAKFVKNRQI